MGGGAGKEGGMEAREEGRAGYGRGVQGDSVLLEASGESHTHAGGHAGHQFPNYARSELTHVARGTKCEENLRVPKPSGDKTISRSVWEATGKAMLLELT